MRDFTRLAVWSKAHQLTLNIYTATSIFPRDEIYGVTSQLRRAASSIGANIAEGCGRDGDVELARFLVISMGSANEVENFLLLARDLNYIQPSQYESLVADLTEIRRMQSSFLRRLRAG